MKRIHPFFWSFLFLALNISLFSCDDDDVPPAENEEEIIASVTLLFTPDNGGEALSFTYSDPDGDGGSKPPSIEPIVLAANTSYTMTIALAGVNGENITAEVNKEADEHMFFFGWTQGLFSAPQGTGNITSRSGTVDYKDKDANNQPLGLITSWITADAATGTFTTILKHQPDSKTATSTVETGETDIEVNWPITIQ